MAELRTGPKSVNEIVGTTGLKQPNVSNHLARMRAKNIVRGKKVGRHVYYRLASPEVEAVVNSAFSHSGRGVGEVDTEEIVKGYAKAAVQGDEATCGELLETAFRAHMPMVDIYQDILGPAMAMVGTWYKVEAIDEAQEHLASEITERMMARTVQITGPTKRCNKVALLGCAPNNWHVIGLRMISDYLRLNGWRTLFLGANVPLRSFRSAVEQHRPDMVLLSVCSSDGLEHTLKVVSELDAIRQIGRAHFVLGVGGPCVGDDPARFAEAGVDFSSKDLRCFALNLLPEIERTGCVPAGGCGLRG